LPVTVVVNTVEGVDGRRIDGTTAVTTGIDEDVVERFEII